jgi:RNA polymerase sigma factor (sigma-70 family)
VSDDQKPPRRALGEISTSWRQINDPVRFVLTYGPAVHAYVRAIIRDEDAADEVLQDLVVGVAERGFAAADPERGRFRDYLRAVARNAALRHLRGKARRPATDGDLDRLAADPGADTTWVAQWRRCVLDKAWRGLERHQRAAGAGNLSYTVLRIAVEHPDEDSSQQAERAAALSGRPLTPEAFRKQLSRGRRVFAGLIADEVKQTLEEPTPDAVNGELAELGLLEYVRDYLTGGG